MTLTMDEKQELEKYRNQKLRESEYNKKYVKEHREKMNQIRNKYYHTHKDEILIKIVCESCGGRFSKASKSSHCKSQKHLKSLCKNKTT
jgi:DNA-binding TFAR19-related protein (PDSD5 family)